MPKELIYVVFPLISPTISLGSTVVFTLFLHPKLLTLGGLNGSSMTIAYYVVNMVEATKLEEAATAGIFFSVIGAPIIFLMKWLIDKITPQVEF